MSAMIARSARAAVASALLLAASVLVSQAAPPEKPSLPERAASDVVSDTGEKEKPAAKTPHDDKPRTLHIKVMTADPATDVPRNAEGATVYVSKTPTLTVPTGKDGSAKLPGVRPGPTQLIVLAIASPRCQLPIDAAKATSFTVIVLKTGCSLSP